MNMIDLYKLKKYALLITTSEGTKKYFVTGEQYKEIRNLLNISEQEMDETYIKLTNWEEEE